MNVSLKFIFIFVLLMLSYNIGGNVVNSMDSETGIVECERCDQVSEFDTNDSMFDRFMDYNKSIGSILSDVELGLRIVETYSSNNYRLRRIIEAHDSLKDIMRKFFLLREGSLVLLGNKYFYSDKDPHYSIISSDCYVFALRRILI